jgi:hypothetical protein
MADDEVPSIKVVEIKQEQALVMRPLVAGLARQLIVLKS